MQINRLPDRPARTPTIQSARRPRPFLAALLSYSGAIGWSAFISSFLVGCSWISGPEPTQNQTALESISAPVISRVGIFIARGSLFKVPEFEQYRLNGSTLFVECGIVRSKRPQARERFLVQLTSSDLEEVQSSAFGLEKYLARRRSQLDEPGSALGFSDPGQATFQVEIIQPGASAVELASSDSANQGTSAADAKPAKIPHKSSETIDLKTSLDQIASEPRSSPLRGLVTTLRRIARENVVVGPEELAGLCENPSFYGID